MFLPPLSTLLSRDIPIFSVSSLCVFRISVFHLAYGGTFLSIALGVKRLPQPRSLAQGQTCFRFMQRECS